MKIECDELLVICDNCGHAIHVKELNENSIELNRKNDEQLEIVRCRECKHWEYDVIFADGWCRGRHQGDPNWFCADGERKESNG